MARLTVSTASPLRGILSVPGDKSISHRALLLASLCRGETLLHGWLDSDDVRRTREALRALRVSIRQEGSVLRVSGRGREGFQAPGRPLDMGNSGTTTRLLLGILAGCPFRATLAGDESLSQRPMRRVTEPLEKMGARFEGPNGLDKLPLTIQGGKLRGIEYTMRISSAQVKSAILLAGLAAEGKTTVIEPVTTRDHTERMLKFLGAKIKVVSGHAPVMVSLSNHDVRPSTGSGRTEPTCITVEPGPLRSGEIELHIPGDFSSAAFFLVAAAIVPGSRVTIQNVGLNPTRAALLGVLQRMGAEVKVEQDHGSEEWEPAGSVTVSHSKLEAVTIEPPEIPGLIDELPILMVAATQAKGKTQIRGAGELRVKETDRIVSMVEELERLGTGKKVYAVRDDVTIEGPIRLHGGEVGSRGDHRTAMSLVVAGLAAEGTTTVHGAEWITISFPGFAESLQSLRG